MFGRVSTVPIRDYLEAEYRQIGYVGGNGGAGIYLCKKFNDEYVKVDGVYHPKLSGWVDVNETTGERSYPDYAFPSNLPEWVVTKEVNYFSGAIVNAERFIIETDGIIGPFTLQEALYFYSITKNFKPEPLNQTISTSGAGFSLDVPLSNNIEGEFSPVFDPDENDPKDLFTPSLKGRSVLYSFGSKYEDNLDANGNGSTFGSDVELYVGGAYASYGDTNVFIVVDVDDLSKFYIAGFKELALADSGSIYNGSAGASATTSINSGPPDYIGGSSTQGIGKTVYMQIHKFKTEFNGTELSNVGDTASKTENGNDITVVTEVEYIGSSAIFSFGSVSKTISTYGIATTVTTTSSFGDEPPPLPDVTVTGLTPASPIEIKANEYWPYKNASGQPVYNTTTGAIVNSPLS